MWRLSSILIIAFLSIGSNAYTRAPLGRRFSSLNGGAINGGGRGVGGGNGGGNEGFFGSDNSQNDKTPDIAQSSGIILFLSQLLNSYSKLLESNPYRTKIISAGEQN